MQQAGFFAAVAARRRRWPPRRCGAAARRAARCWSCSPARAARPARRPTRSSASIAGRRRRPRPLLPGRLLGLSRLEGHARQPRQHRAPEGLCRGPRRPPGLHAAGRRQRPRARRRQQPPADRGGADAPSPPLAGADHHSSQGPTRSTVTIGAAADAGRRKGTIWLVMYDEPVTVPIERGENTRQDRHLLQRRAQAPPDRHVEGRGDDGRPAEERDGPGRGRRAAP